jgi:rRNA processing protein Gar1
VQPGDLVRLIKHGHIGVVVDVFGDLDPEEPWVYVLFTHPAQSYQWRKKSSLVLLVTKKSGSL